METSRPNEYLRDEEAFLELLAADLEPLYLPRLPYHNWDEHILSGVKAIALISDEATSKGKTVNKFMATVAYMGHDAGYSHDLIEPTIWEPYGSKEGYSAHIMETILRGYDFEEGFIDGVKTCIMFTKLGEELPLDIDDELRNTATAVRMADLFNVPGPYKGFILNSFKLLEEDRVYGRERSLEEFKNITQFVLTNFMKVDFLPVGACRIVDGKRNIEKFMKASPKRLLTELGGYATRFSSLIKKDVA
jgi:hypothetical protein